MKIELTRSSRKETERLLEKYAEITGKGVEDGIKEVGKSVARRLAITVQPYGLTSAKGKSFMDSIGHQVDRVVFGMQIGAFPQTTIKDAHAKARRRGSVPKQSFKGRATGWREISGAEVRAYRAKAQSKAGRGKAAWVAAGNAIGAGKLRSIAKWVSRHSGAYGSAGMTGKGLKLSLQLENKTPYIKSIQNQKDISKSIKQGYRNGYKRLERIIRRAEKKAAKLSK